MTIPEHIEILRRGPRVWNAWRDENPSVVPDLAGVALSIGDRQMGPINGGPINLSRALLAEATLYFATLTGADLRGSDLKNADLRGARLEGVDLTGADLAGAQLDGASLSGAVLKAANLSDASLADVIDLTADQIGEAQGNLVTVLPPDLERPAVWTVGQEVLHIRTAPVIAQEPDIGIAREEAAEEDDAVASVIEDDRIPFITGAEIDVASDQMAGPQTLSHDEDEWVRHVADRDWADPAFANRPDAPAPEPIEQTHTETSAPVLPNVEPDLSQSASEQGEPKLTIPRESRQLNGDETRDSNDRDESENKHVSWLVGGPRRTGRPARHWRDRA
jgi:hypothetical protein